MPDVLGYKKIVLTGGDTYAAYVSTSPVANQLVGSVDMYCSDQIGVARDQEIFCVMAIGD